MPEFRDELLVALAEGGLLVGPDQSAAVQEELGERRAGKERKGEVEGSKVNLYGKLITRQLCVGCRSGERHHQLERA